MIRRGRVRTEAAIEHAPARSVIRVTLHGGSLVERNVLAQRLVEALHGPAVPAPKAAVPAIAATQRIGGVFALLAAGQGEGRTGAEAPLAELPRGKKTFAWVPPPPPQEVPLAVTGLSPYDLPFVLAPLG